MKRIAIYLNDDEDTKLLSEVDVQIRKIYSNRTHFTKLAWRFYVNWLKKQDRKGNI